MSPQDDEAPKVSATRFSLPGGWRTRGAQPPPLVLFLCRSNTASSIMAEAILEHLAQGRVRAASAGNIPAGQVNPYTLECLRVHAVATRGLRSKPWGEFLGLHKPAVHFLITLCEVDAVKADWSRDTSTPVKAHWEMPDPTTVVGSAVHIRLAFEEAFGMLESRIRKFLALPLGRLTNRALSRELGRIGEE
jgi:arsenate reductase (thioredoxin)